jgi:hypothetical protein
MLLVTLYHYHAIAPAVHPRPLPVRALISAESLSASASLPASALATAKPEASLRLHTCHTPSYSRSVCRRPRRLSESSAGSCRPAPLGLGPSAHDPYEAAVDIAPEALQPQGARLPTPLRHLQGLPVGIPTPPKPSGAYGLRTRQNASADLLSRAWTATLRSNPTTRNIRHMVGPRRKTIMKFFPMNGNIFNYPPASEQYMGMLRIWMFYM